MDGIADKSMQPPAPVLSSNAELEEKERKARVDAVWKSMNKGVSTKTLKLLSSKTVSAANGTSKKEKSSQSWMTYLGMASKKSESRVDHVQDEKNPAVQSGISDEAKKLAAAALTAVKDGAPLVQGKVEITEIRDFAGQDIEVKKFVDPNSREATEKAKTAAGQSSAVDSILEQIRKKQKLNVLDKTKKDWGEFKQEKKGLEDELDAYKKSANQYLDKVSFLERTDYREFERERDARLAVHAKKIPDMREEP
ncbi:Craniofacial development protein 1-like protein [Drosera capensis]